MEEGCSEKDDGRFSQADLSLALPSEQASMVWIKDRVEADIFARGSSTEGSDFCSVQIVSMRFPNMTSKKLEKSR